MSGDAIGFGDPVNKDERSSGQPTKKKKGGKKSGGFESMGLSFLLLKGIKKRGYKIPTPIQRKTIPLVLEGRDVVAMARTGSGKTACFLLPLLERLRTRRAQSGARALIMSPTRELALQTFKFFRELGCFTGLRAALILGGDSMDYQFGALHGNPDVIVATPGRFTHVCVEMDLKLASIEYVVFDEADRLFEMGFGEQLREMLGRLPESRQTLLFSATLPKVLVDFAKAGLSDPVLLRLDVDTKLPEHLKLGFICCHSEEKPAALLCLLKHVVPPGAQTVIFAATMHHVEYLHLILDAAGISNTFIYSNLDPSARKINTAKFHKGKVSVLIVTDIAARGIDIPQLDVVINYSFPAKSKLFVHRVGRCARAGRSGIALSLLSGDEHPYLLDLYLFLGRPLKLQRNQHTLQGEEWPDGVVGGVPRSLLEEEHSRLLHLHRTLNDLANMKKVSGNAYRQYLKSRPGASAESVRRFKEMDVSYLEHHPVFKSSDSPEKLLLLQSMKTYKPPSTIFEISQTAFSEKVNVMKMARQKHEPAISSYSKKKKKKEEEERERQQNALAGGKEPIASLAASSADIRSSFSQVIIPKRPRPQNHLEADRKKHKRRKVTVDEEHYIPYTSADQHTEQGLAMRSFEQEAGRMELSLTGDSEDNLQLQRKLKRWDIRKKKMVAVPQANKKKILSESGVWIPASFKTNRYNDWKEKSKILEQAEAKDDSSGDESDADTKKKPTRKLTFPNTHWGRHNKKVQQQTRIGELKRPDQILKARLLKEDLKRRELKNLARRKKRKNRR